MADRIAEKNNASAAAGLLAPLKSFMEHPHVSEIIINQPEEVWIEQGATWQQHKIKELTANHLYQLFRLVANESQQRFDKTHPLLSASLYDGSRIQCIHPPTALHYTMAIRRKTVKNFTLDNYSNHNFYQSIKPVNLLVERVDDLLEADQQLLALYAAGDWQTLIQQAIKSRKNIVISGGTSSGKTTFLNACLQAIDHEERIITLEDVREVDIPHQNKVQLLTSKGQQGEAKITMQDLVQCSLRLRPDRIIMGEIRGGEIMDFVNACSTGHEGSITSIHANNPTIALMRMVQLYKLNNVPSMTNDDILQELKQVIDIIVQINKTPHGRAATAIYYRYQHLAPQLKTRFHECAAV